jgi:flagellar biosynthesis/type III secretory pathway chaperone
MNQTQLAAGHEDISGLIAVTRRLTDLLTAEISALRAMRPKDIAPLQDEKAELTNIYETRLRTLQNGAIELKDMSPELAAELGQTTRVLREVIADNQRVLKAVRQVNADVINVIANDISRQRNPAETYGERGQPARASQLAKRQPGPLKLDRSA